MPIEVRHAKVAQLHGPHPMDAQQLHNGEVATPGRRVPVRRAKQRSNGGIADRPGRTAELIQPNARYGGRQVPPRELPLVRKAQETSKRRVQVPPAIHAMPLGVRDDERANIIDGHRLPAGTGNPVPEMVKNDPRTEKVPMDRLGRDLAGSNMLSVGIDQFGFRVLGWGHGGLLF